MHQNYTDKLKSKTFTLCGNSVSDQGHYLKILSFQQQTKACSTHDKQYTNDTNGLGHSKYVRIQDFLLKDFQGLTQGKENLVTAGF